jgi:THO complex subunit 4
LEPRRGARWFRTNTSPWFRERKKLRIILRTAIDLERLFVAIIADNLRGICIDREIMADEALNKSLDDLIKEQRAKQVGAAGSSMSPSTCPPHCFLTLLFPPSWRPLPVQKQKKKTKPAKSKATPKGKEGATPTPGAAGKPRRRGRRSATGGPKAPPADLKSTAKGAVTKRSGKARMRPMIVDGDTRNPAMKVDKLEGNARWTHDLFSAGGGKGRGRGNRLASHLGTKLFISNLAYKVTSEDVRELFGTVGPLVSSSVHYDRSGKSAGTAEAVFHSREDAVKAQSRYNGVQLDGRPMAIELIEQGAAPEPAERTLKSGIKITRNAAQAIRQAGSKPLRGQGTLKSRVVVGADAMQE